ncbi:hypothetical protein [uncultured Celeribacter sp.]|uniref:hypothetical protein n=1 Tax=uncultured Celeribacter sp. TaxID=1303376 RepID=UPI002AA74D9D|nr:hypothetical protein [uncultured Celeribacter sp.]
MSDEVHRFALCRFSDREPISYSEAVAFATEFLRPCAEPRGVCDSFTIKGAERSREAMLGLEALKGPDPESFLEKARHDPVLFRRARFALAIKDERGEAMTTSERRWDLDFRFDAMPQPKAAKPGPRPKPQSRHPYAQEIFIVQAISALVQRGMTATRGDNETKTSACDAVSDAMFGLGLTPADPSDVRKTWNRTRKSMTTVARRGDWWR